MAEMVARRKNGGGIVKFCEEGSRASRDAKNKGEAEKEGVARRREPSFNFLLAAA